MVSSAIRAFLAEADIPNQRDPQIHGRGTPCCFPTLATHHGFQERILKTLMDAWAPAPRGCNLICLPGCPSTGVLLCPQ